MFDFLPSAVQTALTTLKQAGVQAVLVGRCVRDELMGVPPHDHDIAAGAPPEKLKEIFAAWPLILDGEKHGTITPVIDHTAVEITSFRTESGYRDGRHPDVVSFTASLSEDLSRRDFTVNAMAWSPEEGLTDLFGGREDLEKGVIRCVGDPAERFSEDSLRILRGMRFASRLGFAIEEETARAMHAQAEGLRQISRERIHTELTGTLTGAHAMEVLSAFPDVVFAVIPELFPLYHCPQKSVYHIYDVWEHTLHVLDEVTPRTPLLCWAALLHDCAKPLTRHRDRKGFDHYPGHQQEGARLAESVCKSLKMSNQMIRDITTLVLWHDERMTEDQVPLMLYRVGPELFDDLIALQKADMLAHAERISKDAGKLDALLLRRDQAIKNGECIGYSTLAVTGDDLKALGWQGKELGQSLEWALMQVLKGKLPNDRDTLLREIGKPENQQT